MITKITQVITVALLAFVVVFTYGPVASAQTDNWENLPDYGEGGRAERELNESGVSNSELKEDWKDCGGAETSILACSSKGGEDTIIWILRFVVVLMTMGVGVLAVAGVVYAGVLYASAGGSQEQVKKAKMMLFNVALGLVAYAFMYAITNFLIPGGVFN